VTKAHRFSWEMAHGPVPDDQCVLHNCPNGDNPKCVNPAHLFLGTRDDNNKDKVKKGRQSRRELHGLSVLTSSEVEEIRSKYANGGYLQRELASEYGVCRQAVGLIVLGKRWRAI